MPEFEVAKNFHVLKDLIGALNVAEGSWLGFGILIMNSMYSGTLLGNSLEFSFHSDQ